LNAAVTVFIDPPTRRFEGDGLFDIAAAPVSGDGILEVYAGDKLVKRFMKIDKLTTATGTHNDEPRPYRYGYGVLDADLDGQPDPGAKQIYFEISDYSTSYVFYENPR